MLSPDFVCCRKLNRGKQSSRGKKRHVNNNNGNGHCSIIFVPNTVVELGQTLFPAEGENKSIPYLVPLQPVTYPVQPLHAFRRARTLAGRRPLLAAILPRLPDRLSNQTVLNDPIRARPVRFELDISAFGTRSRPDVFPLPLDRGAAERVELPDTVSVHRALHDEPRGLVVQGLLGLQAALEALALAGGGAEGEGCAGVEEEQVAVLAEAGEAGQVPVSQMFSWIFVECERFEGSEEKRAFVGS